MSLEQSNHEDRKAIEAAGEVLNKLSRVSCEVLNGWMHSQCPQVQSQAMYVILTRRYMIDSIPPQADNFCLLLLQSFIVQNVNEDNADDYLPDRWEAAGLLGSLFSDLWLRQPRPDADLEKVKNVMGSLIRSGGETVKEAILLRALEHLWTDPEIASFFASWRSDSELASVYAEGLELAEGWRNMQRKTKRGRVGEGDSQ